MNDFDEIVGYVYGEAGEDDTSGAFLSLGGAFPTLLADLNSNGLSVATAIDDHLQIVGPSPTLMQPTPLAPCRKLATPVSCL